MQRHFKSLIQANGSPLPPLKKENTEVKKTNHAEVLSYSPAESLAAVRSIAPSEEPLR